MPKELRLAHKANDKAVMAAYGFAASITEAGCVAELFGLYREMVRGWEDVVWENGIITIVQ